MIQKAACGLVVFFTLIGGVWAANKVFVPREAYVALEERVAKGEIRLDNKIRSDQILSIREQIFQLEQQNKGRPMSPSDAKRLHDLRQLLRDLEANG